jgi:hypothetical protein
MLEEHEAAVAQWEANCKTLQESGTRAKDLPKKPKRPLKPKLRETVVRRQPDQL